MSSYTVWTPFRHLIQYSMKQAQAKLPEGAIRRTSDVFNTARGDARALLRSAYADSRVPERFKWTRPTNIAYRHREFGGKLRRLVSRPVNHSRTMLEDLLMAYYAQGFGLKPAVDRAFVDYESIDSMVVPLTIRDVFDYATFFWNFSGASHEGQERYIKEHLRDTTAAAIFDGRTTILDLRVRYGVTQSYQLGDEVKRLSMITMKTSQKAGKELYANDRAIQEARAYKDISAHHNTAIVVAKASTEIGADDEAAMKLSDYIDEKWAEIDQDPPDYHEIEDHDMSPDELYAENSLHGEDGDERVNEAA